MNDEIEINTYSNSPLPIEVPDFINDLNSNNNNFLNTEKTPPLYSEPNSVEYSFDELKTILSNLFTRHSLSKKCFKDIIDTIVLTKKFDSDVINQLAYADFFENTNSKADSFFLCNCFKSLSTLRSICDSCSLKP